MSRVGRQDRLVLGNSVKQRFLITLLRGLTPGLHGIHLHAVGTCDGPAFTSAGPHINPSAAHHGLSNPQGPHAGDLPNITADANGNANVDLDSQKSVTVASLKRSRMVTRVSPSA